MALSPEFKRAIAAAAVTRLSAGGRNVDAAAAWVSERLGDALYADRRGAAMAAMIIDDRKKILAAANDRAESAGAAVARYHYDRCLDWVAKAGLKPEESARLLIDTLLRTR